MYIICVIFCSAIIPVPLEPVLHGMASAGRAAPASRFLHKLKWSITHRFDTFSPHFHGGTIGNMPISEVADDGFAYDPARNIIYCVWCGASMPEWQSVSSVNVIKQLHNNTCPRGPPLDEFPVPTTADTASAMEDQIEGLAEEVDLSARSSAHSAGFSELRRENERMKEERKCKKCNRAQVETLFLPCRHLVACETCADEVDDCFKCGTKILGTVRIYMM